MGRDRDTDSSDSGTSPDSRSSNDEKLGRTEDVSEDRWIVRRNLEERETNPQSTQQSSESHEYSGQLYSRWPFFSDWRITESPYRIGIGEFSVERSPETLRTTGLGSCIAVALYYNDGSVGGLIHCMLPYQDKISGSVHPLRFVDRGVRRLTDIIVAETEAETSNLTAKIVGGSRMFGSAEKRDTTDKTADSVTTIGARNVFAARETLSELGIPILAEDTGGTKARSIKFRLSSGDVIVRSKTHEDIIL